MNSYKTIGKEGKDEYIVKHSRFIGSIMPVASAEEATAFISAKKQEYWDATHNVYAYVLRDGQTRRYSDDGEPQGTAGIPVLDVLLKEGVCDCAVVVTRYFGGIMLGAGGLVRAYSHSAKIALDDGGVVTMKLCAVSEIICDYSFYGKLVTFIPELGGIIDDSVFEEKVKIKFRIDNEFFEKFCEELTDMSNGQLSCQKTGEIFCAVA